MRGPLQDKTRTFGWAQARPSVSAPPRAPPTRPARHSRPLPPVGAGPAAWASSRAAAPNDLLNGPVGVRLGTGNGHLGLAAGVVARLGGPRQPRSPQPPPVTPAGPAHVALGQGGCMYLQSLQPRVVGVHQPGPLWGTQGCGQPGAVTPHPTPAAPGSGPPTSTGAPHPPAPAGTRSGGTLGVLPSSFFFASSNPNWGSDSRTLHGEERASLTPRTWPNALCPPSRPAQHRCCRCCDTDTGPNSTRQPAPGLGQWERQPTSTPLAHKAPSGGGRDCPHPPAAKLPGPRPLTAASLWLGCSV